MLKNYFKIAWRNLLRNKGLSFINIFGLAIGMAFAMLIGLWIQYETSFNKFHQNIDRIALVRKNTLFNNEKNTQVGIPLAERGVKEIVVRNTIATLLNSKTGNSHD